jgi:hypothetical protein
MDMNMTTMTMMKAKNTSRASSVLLVVVVFAVARRLGRD